MFHDTAWGSGAFALVLSVGLASGIGYAQSGVNMDVGHGSHDIGAQPSQLGGGPKGNSANENAAPAGSATGGGELPATAAPSQAVGTGPGAEGLSGPSAPMFFITDASIFTSNAMNTASGLSHEQALPSRSAEPGVLEGQAMTLVMSTGRALNSLEALQHNAERNNPQAVPAIRQAISNLVVAQAEARSAASAIRAKQFGSSYANSIHGALTQLENADTAIARAGQAYGVAYERGETPVPNVEQPNAQPGATTPSTVTPPPPAQGGGALPEGQKSQF